MAEQRARAPFVEMDVDENEPRLVAALSDDVLPLRHGVQCDVDVVQSYVDAHIPLELLRRERLVSSGDTCAADMPTTSAVSH